MSRSRPGTRDRLFALLIAALLVAPLSVMRASPVAAAGAPFSSLTCTDLEPLPISASTGEKPQSKVWTHGGEWWAVLPTTGTTPGAGTWLWKLAGTTWTSVLKLSDNTDTHADVTDTGSVAHILLYRGTSSELASIEYTGTTYERWSQRPANAGITLTGASEPAATVALDSAGRLWVAWVGANDVWVSSSVSPYASWTTPFSLASGVLSDDIAVATAMPGDKIGVLWSNENASVRRFGFRTHADASDLATWTADEVPAGSAAIDGVGTGMADDHLNVAVASDGTLYAAVKTSYDTAGYPKMALLVRRPSGTWDPLYAVDEAGTRPIILLNEPAGELLYVYTSSEGYNDTVYRTSATSSISFSARHTLISGGVNDTTSTKQNYTNDIVILASDADNARGVRCTAAAVNTAPVAGADTYSTNLDTPLSINAPGVLVNDTDADANPLTAIKVSDPGHGTVALSANGSFTYTPVAGYVGTDSFTYKANDGAADSNVATVSITVGSDLRSWWRMDEGSGTSLLDSSGNGNNAATAGSPTWVSGKIGSWALSLNGTSQYASVASTSSLNITGSITIAAWIKPAVAATQDLVAKETGGADGYQLSLATPSGSTGKVFVRFNNDANSRVDSLTTYPSDGSSWVHVAATYDGTTVRLYYNGTEQANRTWAGPIKASASALGIGAQSNNARWFKGSIDDVRLYSRALSASEIAALYSPPANHAPVAVADTYSTPQNTPLTVTAPGVLANDTDADANPLTATKVTDPVHGTVTLNPNGSFTYTPTAGYSGTDSFTYKANDGMADSNVATVSMTITAVNTPPVASPDSYVTSEGTSLSLAAPGVLANDTDVDANPLTAAKVTDPVHGTVTLNPNGSFTYTPTAGYNGTDSFTYKANDGTADSNVATVSIAVVPALRGSWQMDEGTGSVVSDGSTFANTGSISGTPAWVAGKVGSGALGFDGADTCVTVPDSDSLDLTRDMTIAAWIKPGQVGTQSLVTKAVNGSIGGYELALATSKSDATSQKVFFRLNQVPSGDTYRINSSTEYPVDGNTWIHVAATYDGTTMRLYINGAEQASMDASVSVAPNDVPLGIGCQAGGGPTRWFKGALDDVRVYARALSPSEVTALSVTNHGPNSPALGAPADGSTIASGSTTLAVDVSDPDGGSLTTTFYGRPAATAPDFTVAVLPDTQNYSASYPSTFTAQTNWIATTRSTLNTVFVTHVGDIVNTTTNSSEWTNAKTSMSVLDSAAIPYGFSKGNHDGATEFDATFPLTDYSAKPWFGGSMPGKGYRDSYELVDVGGLRLIVLHLEFEAASDVLAWADGVLIAHPDRRAIVTTHEFLDGSGNRTSWAAGAWASVLAPNCNVFLVLSGHYTREASRSDTTTGTGGCSHTVYQVLQDYQLDSNGGNGWLRYYTFHPATNSIDVHTYSPTLAQSETDANSSFSLPYDMSGAGEFQEIGSVTSPSGSRASLTWTGLAPGTAYEWYASVGDGTATTTGPTWGFSTEAAQLEPTSTVLASTSNPSTYGDSVTFTATVAPVDPGAGTPTGTVRFSIDGETFDETLDGDGHAFFTTSALGTAGSPHVIGASYLGDATFEGSASSPLGQVVDPAVSVTTLDVSPNPSTYTQSVTLTASVDKFVPQILGPQAMLPDNAANPTGTVEFLDGSTSLGTAPLDADGYATLDTAALTAGTHPLTAHYLGDGTFNASTSDAVSQVVTQGAQTITFATLPNKTYGDPGFTVSATASSGLTVTFSSSTQTVCTVSVAGAVALVGAGTCTITAAQPGDATWDPAAPVSRSFTVAKAITGTVITGNPNPATLGATVTFTITVTSTAGTPSGTVTVRDGATTLCAAATLNGSGVATCQTSSLAIGNHTISATYNGAANFASSAGSVTEAVKKPKNK